MPRWVLAWAEVEAEYKPVPMWAPSRALLWVPAVAAPLRVLALAPLLLRQRLQIGLVQRPPTAAGSRWIVGHLEEGVPPVEEVPVPHALGSKQSRAPVAPDCSAPRWAASQCWPRCRRRRQRNRKRKRKRAQASVAGERNAQASSESLSRDSWASSCVSQPAQPCTCAAFAHWCH